VTMCPDASPTHYTNPFFYGKASVSPALSIESLRTRQPLLWLNPALSPVAEVGAPLPLGLEDIRTADALLRRWAPALTEWFPELLATQGVIESPLVRLSDPPAVLRTKMPGNVWIKQDHALPVAGSIKARGGIFEVLTIAEDIMAKEGQAWTTPLAPLQPALRRRFADYTVSVGSTGNLGLAIGMMGSALGMNCVVHMSRDAKDWKKRRLRDRGVIVIEHDGDFAAAVAAGRSAARQEQRHYFVDDERSRSLFLGYATAALRLREQLAEAGIVVDPGHPLFVYLPCGVGGAPGGIAFGLKQVFGDAVHGFFAEPCASASMLARFMTGVPEISVHDVGLDNVTEADGLAVGRASEFAYAMVRELVSGIFTVRDDDMFRYLYRLRTTQGIAIEPSAAAGFAGPAMLWDTAEGRRYLDERNLRPVLAQATHLLWTTGGALVPAGEYQRFFDRGQALAAKHEAATR